MSSISKNKYIDDLDGIVNPFLHLTQRIHGKKLMVFGLFVKSHFWRGDMIVLFYKNNGKTWH